MALSGTAGRVRIHGPLEEYVPGFEAVLLRSGFTPASVVNQLHLVAHLSRWLESSGVDLRDLTGVQVDAFLRERRGTHTRPQQYRLEPRNVFLQRAVNPNPTRSA